MKILVVEDEHSLARMIEVELLLQNMDVEVCHTGKDALARAIEKEFDLVILDWMLPDIEGIEVCRILRSRGLETSIIMITARQDVAYEVRGLTEGADDFLVKPFDIEQLVARIHAVTRRLASRKTAPPRILFDSLVIDLETRAVYRRGQRVHVTKKEFEILVLLLANRGKVVTKEEIHSSVWGKDIHIEEAVIAVHMKAIRDKLGELRIGNVRGVGYIIENPDRGIRLEG